MAITFQDRVATRPNRYKITKESGASEYVTLERADVPSVVGTPLNASTFNALVASMRPNTWLPTIAEIGAAPAGHGLGTEVVSLGNKSVDNITGNGFYFGYVGLPEVFGNSFILHLDYGNYCQQLVFSLTATTGYGNLFIRREKNGGIWGEWEWETPLMRPGVEYRTTERWNGKPVYTKLINCGALTTSGRMPVYIGYLGVIIRFAGHCDFGALPYRDPNANGTIDMAAEKDYIIFNVNVTAEKQAMLGTAYAQIWYT